MKPVAFKGNEPYIFVSYAHADSERVLPIVAKMQEQGFRVWFDQGVEVGAEWPQFIAERLENAENVIVFMSNAANQSKNCRQELLLAVEREVDPMIVYLEEVELSAGQKLMIGNLHALMGYNLENVEQIAERLCETEMLQNCRETEEDTQPTRSEKAARIFDIVLPIFIVIALFFVLYKFCGWQFLGFRLDGLPMQSTTSFEETAGDRQHAVFKFETKDYNCISDVYYRKSDGLVYAMDITYVYDLSKDPQAISSPEKRQQLIEERKEYSKKKISELENADFVSTEFNIYGNDLNCTVHLSEIDNNENAMVAAKKFFGTYDCCIDAVGDNYLMSFEKMSDVLVKGGAVRQ